MKTLWKEIFLAMLMGMILPGILLSAVVWIEEEPEPVREEKETILYDPKTPSVPISVRMGDTQEEQDLEDYLVGVVLAEMPAYFEQEALKAQAVVARTYTVRAASTGGKHGDGSICTDSRCCQAYLTEEAYLEKGGSPEAVEKVRAAVENTAGQVLTYEGEWIEATYFSCSGGRTEDAAAVWGTDYPYLRSVDSPGEESASHYTDTVMFTAAEFQEKLGWKPEGNPQSWFGDISYTAGQGVDTISIGGREYKGTQLRQKLGLRSTAFTISVTEDTISIRTKGYGHRVGMSQYGAEAMAVAGNGYSEILAYYYQGTELVSMTEEELIPS